MVLNVDELTALLDAATPGPWATDSGQCCTYLTAAVEGGSATDENENIAEVFSVRDGADAGLIAALRNAAPALIAAVRERDALRAAVATMAHDVAIVKEYHWVREVGGQHVGTGGPLGNAPPSTLLYLERLLREVNCG